MEMATDLASFKFNGKWLDCGNWQRYFEVLKNGNNLFFLTSINPS